MLFSELQVKTVPAGTVIIEQGKENDTFYIIKQGSVDVSATSADTGTATKLSTLSGGEYFGERSLLTAEPAAANVSALDSCELMLLTKTTFEALLGPMQKMLEREANRREKQRLEVSEAKIAFADLDLRQVLGEGSFGSVRLAIHTKTKTAYALKQLHKGHLISTNQVNNTVNEKSIMKMCVHPFVLACHGSFNSKAHVQLLLGLAQVGSPPLRPLVHAYPSCRPPPPSASAPSPPAHRAAPITPSCRPRCARAQGGELFTRMSKVGTLSGPATGLYVAMVASALGFLSSRSIAHRDLKLENLLFDDKVRRQLIAPPCILHPTSYILQHTAYSIQHTSYSIQHTSYSIPRTTPLFHSEVGALPAPAGSGLWRGPCLTPARHPPPARPGLPQARRLRLCQGHQGPHVDLLRHA